MRGAPIGAEVGLRLEINKDYRPIEPGDVIESVSGLLYLVDSIRKGPKWYALRVVKLDPTRFGRAFVPDWIMVS